MTISSRVAAPRSEGLRDRKKRLIRQQLVDTATTLFLDHGFDGVRVTDVADRCGVSEKTVYNYFPTKEALILDRWGSATVSLQDAFGDREPLDACLTILADELEAVFAWLRAQPDLAEATDRYRRFGEQVAATDALSAYQHERFRELVDDAAAVLARRSRATHTDPRVRITAIALIGLWQIQTESLMRNLNGRASLLRVRRRVTADVESAAVVLTNGLATTR